MDNIDEFEFKQSLKNTKVSEYPPDAFSYYGIFNLAFKKAVDYADYYNILQNSPIDFLQDKIEDIIIYGHIGVEDIPEVLLNDKNVAVLLTKKQLYSMDFLPFNLRDDEEFINEIAQINGNILKYATSRIRNIDYILENAIRANSESLQYIPDSKKTIDLCDLALFNNNKGFPEVWQYVPEYLNKEWYIKSVGKKVPEIYKYIDQKFKDDIIFTNTFLEYSDILEFASDVIKDNDESVELACSRYTNERWYNFKHASDRLKNDSSFVWKIVKYDANQIHYCGESIKNDTQLALKMHANNSCKSKKNILEFFNEKVKSNEAVAMAALKFDYLSAPYISHKLKNNKNFLINYIEQEEFKAFNLQYFSINLRNDKEIMLKAATKNSSSLNHISQELKFSQQFLNDLLTNKETDIFIKHIQELNFTNEEELPFLNSLKVKYDNNYLQSMEKQFFLKFIENNAFYSHLNLQPNIYEYLLSFELFEKLEERINNKISSKNKSKI